MKLHTNPQRDLNPIIDEGDPTCNGWVYNEAPLCDALGIQMDISPPSAFYRHECGSDCEDAKNIMDTWYLTVNDAQGRPKMLPVDLMEGIWPLLIGLNEKRDLNSPNRMDPTALIFKRPMDREERMLHTYICKDYIGNPRLRM